ncbi:MAG: sugar phosphate isomerase/epimerase [Dehalococcoidia bacterium]|nr:MAG: sugar phosphate isomerase/epimerase [Dehalococcoidia bacterium]
MRTRSARSTSGLSRTTRRSGRAFWSTIRKSRDMNTAVELMNLYWTTAGVYPVVNEISRFDFKDRVESAARAGFKGIGIWHTDLEHILFSRTLQEMKMILDDNGIEHLELEFLTDWFLEGARKAESDSRKRRLLEASQALNASHVKVGDFYSTVCPMPHIVEAFSALCKDAEDYGATIAFEFMASAMIDNLKDSLTMVEEAGAKNGGIVLDMAHVANGRISCEQIRSIPLKYLVSVELNDGALPGSPKYDSSRARRFCGEGDFDIKGFIKCVNGMGYTRPWAVEVFSEELLGLSLDALNTRAFETTMAQFED